MLCRGLLSAALKTKGLQETDGCFELSVGNPDKGQLPLDEIKRRVGQFVEQGLPLVVTQVLTGPCPHKSCLDDASSALPAEGLLFLPTHCQALEIRLEGFSYFGQDMLTGYEAPGRDLRFQGRSRRLLLPMRISLRQCCAAFRRRCSP